MITFNVSIISLAWFISIILIIILSSIWIVSAIMDVIEKRRNNKTLHERVVNRLLDVASDDKPIVLTVKQEKLIERVADEVERRQSNRET